MTFAPRTWAVGEVVPAATMNTEIRDQFNSMFAAWTTYTPVWTASTTNPVLGNGTLTGRSMKWGRTVVCHVNLASGSTTTYGTGNHAFSLPYTAASSGVALVGSAQLLNVDRWVGGIVISSGGTTVAPFLPISATNTRTDTLTNTRPETLASGAQVRLTFVYEAAS